MPSTLDSTVFDELIDTIDEVRSTLSTELGNKPFTCYVVTVQWPGRPGLGTPTETTLELVPPPEVSQTPPPNSKHTQTTSYRQDVAGRQEEGGATLSEVSLKYTAAELGDQGEAEGREVVYRLVDRKGQSVPTREYRLAAPPFRDLNNFGWVVSLVRKV